MRSEPPSEWRMVRLGELVSIEHGYAFKSEFFCEPSDGTPVVVSVGNFKYTGGFRFETTSLKGYSGEFPQRFRLRSGDILLVMTCQTQGGEILGIPGRIPADARVYLHNQRLGRVAFRDTARLDPDFAYWLFLDPNFNRELCRTASGSKILHTAPERIEAYRFALPPLGEQRRIAWVLHSIDNKIDSNRRLSALLAETFALRFEATFLRFIEGDDLVESPIGPIPHGWRPGTLADIASVHRSLVKGQSDLPYIGLEAMPRGSTVLTEWVTEDTPTGQAASFEEGDILFGKLRPYFKKVGVAPVTGRCSTEILVLRSKDPRLYGALLGYVSSQGFIDHCVAVSRGTRMPRAEWKDASSFPIAIPSTTLASGTTSLAQTLYGQIAGLTRESRALEAARDHLLPGLISGRIRVPDSKDHDDVTSILEEAAA